MKNTNTTFKNLDLKNLTSPSLKAIGYWHEIIRKTSFDGFSYKDDLFQKKRKELPEEQKGTQHISSKNKILKKLLDESKTSQIKAAQRQNNIDAKTEFMEMMAKNNIFEDGFPVGEDVKRHIVISLQDINRDKEDEYKPILLCIMEVTALPDSEAPIGYVWKIKKNQIPQFNRYLLGEYAENDMLRLRNTTAFDNWCEEILLDNSGEFTELSEAFSIIDTAFEKLASDGKIKNAKDWWESTKEVNKTKYKQLNCKKLSYNLVDGGLLLHGSKNLSENLLSLCDFQNEFECSPKTALISQIISPRERRIVDINPSFADYRGMIHDFDTNTEKYPLEKSQREATRVQRNCKDGELVAVDGPPGTGKTSMLRAVIASEWISAITSNDKGKLIAPIIVATSATNQAVTNIISGFSNVPSPSLFDNAEFKAFINSPSSVTVGTKNFFVLKGSEITLTSRWLPLLSSYGYFCPSTLKSKQAEKFKEFQQLVKIQNKIKTGGSIEGFDKAVEKHLDLLVNIYLHCANIYYKEREKEKEKPKDLKFFANLFKNHLKRKQNDVKVDKLPSEIFQLFDCLFRKAKEIEKLNSDEKCAEFIKKAIEKSIETYQIYKDNIPKSALINLKKDLAQVKFTSESKEEIVRYNSIVDDFLDKYVRSIDFHVAARLYEAEFLIQMSEYTSNNSKPNMSDHELMQLWSMLSPVYVVTAHSLPKLLKCHKKRDESSPAFMYGDVDLLIFDEAGQCAPEIGGGAFAFAKRAIVVGDVNQLEPVWSIAEAQDNLVLKNFETDREKRKFFLESGKMCSSGSLMKMAQQASLLVNHNQKSVPSLSSHYRCAPQIIEICKSLAYPQLDVKTVFKPPLWNEKMRDSLGYLIVDSSEKTTKISGSRSNPSEAKLIAKWISENREDIEKFYDKEISKVLAVVTPFTGQREVLQKEIGEILKETKKVVNKTDGSDVSNLIINTVHSLQGAEKDIVIFSMVETSNPEQKQFFDKGINLINVAASRAKSMFIVAMTQQALKKGQEVLEALNQRGAQPSEFTPSQILWAHVSKGIKLELNAQKISYSPFATSDITQIILNESNEKLLKELQKLRSKIDEYIASQLATFNDITPRMRAAYRIAALTDIFSNYIQQKIDKKLLDVAKDSLFMRWLIDLDISERPISTTEFLEGEQFINLCSSKQCIDMKKLTEGNAFLKTFLAST